MGDCDCLNDAGLLSEGLPYIYIDMYNCDGCGYQLVQE